MTQNTRPQALCGFLNLLKPPGMTSAQAVAKVRKLADRAKIGHAGTLDPEAAGVLPLMIGKAARLFDYLQDKEKEYVAEIAFGYATDTQDAQGKVIAAGEAYPDKEALEAALLPFIGDQLQTPPMFSALKRDGKRLYELARKGQSVELDGRPVTIQELALVQTTSRNGALITVRCSKGFYVRTLCNDLGAALGCPSHMRFLLRTRSGPFTLATAKTLEELRFAAEHGGLQTLLLPMETALEHLPRMDVPHSLTKPFENGVPLPAGTFPSLEEGQAVRMYLDGRLTAIAVRTGQTLRTKTWLGD